MTKSFLGILLKMLQQHMMMIVNIDQQCSSIYVEFQDDKDSMGVGIVVSEFHNLFIPMLQKVGFKFRMR